MIDGPFASHHLPECVQHGHTERIVHRHDHPRRLREFLDVRVVLDLHVQIRCRLSFMSGGFLLDCVELVAQLQLILQLILRVFLQLIYLTVVLHRCRIVVHRHQFSVVNAPVIVAVP